MVSRRTYITIMMLMGIIFFLFIFTGAAKEWWNDYQTNPYAEEGEELISADSVWEIPPGETSAGEETESPGETPGSSEGEGVIYLGDLQNDSAGDTVRQWCFYTKRTLQSYGSLDDWPGLETEIPEILLIEPEYLDRNDIQTLRKLADRGVSMVFCHLPRMEVVRSNRQVRELLGIRKVESDFCTLAGIKLYGGFLLGQEIHYTAETPEEEQKQDMVLELPWYKLGAGTKLYMVGVLDEETYDTVENEELPAILWRAAYGKGKVFAINGAYLEDLSGIGILSAMMSELHEYELYPVVNAQNFIILNGPDLAPENEETIREIYSRSSRLLLRDVVFPNLAALSGITGFPMTCLMTGGLDSRAEASYEDTVYYLKWLREQNAEIGISLAGREENSAGEAAETFRQFLQENGCTYQFSALYVPAGQPGGETVRAEELQELFPGLRTIVCEETGAYRLLDYVSDSVTVQRLTDQAFRHTYAADFRLRAMETGLGYSSISLDLAQVLYPEGEEEHWENLSEKFSSNLNTYWKPFSAFEKTVLTESDRRVRQFLALDYEDGRDGDTIELEVEHLEEQAWFILRTHGERIAEITGGSWEKIEQDAYLLTVTEPHVTITLEETSQRYYYE